MEVAEPEAYSVHPALEEFQEPEKKYGRRWMRHWVPQDTVLGSGSCFLLKWITEDVLSVLQTKQHNVVEEEQEPEEEHEVVYLCTYEGCGKIFPEASGLRKHAHVHGEKQYICQYEGCGKRFVDSSKLKRHFLIHTGEKHFICPFEGCGKAFSLDFNLRSHMRTHTGENYHICPYEDCGKRYAHEYKLKAHMRSFHDKNNPEPTVASPVTDPEKDVVVPKYTPAPAAPPPPPVVEKPFVCPFEGCDKRYIHEYKLNLHLKNAHMINEVVEEEFRPGRVVAQVEDEIEDDSDQDAYQEVVPKYYEQVPKAVEPTQKRKPGPKPSAGKGKLRVVTKPPAKVAKRKRPNPAPADSNLKVHIKHSSAGRSGISRQEFKSEAADDSEETEDEDRDNTEEEDNVKHMGGHMGQHRSEMIGEEDDEETEDDMD
ncbi:unnamed protein product [Calypogeia fissa]